jgi:flagellar basal body rod protein FlgB
LVKFEEYFHNPEVTAKGETTEETHIPLGRKNPGDVEGDVNDAPVPQPEIYFSGETHVNIDKEMSTMAQNQIKYRFASKMVQKYFQGMMTSITGYKQ